MEASSDQYRSSSSSASSSAAGRAAARRYYFPKPGRPISFEDSPDWGDDITAHNVDDSIHLTTASVTSSAYPPPSPSLPEPSASAFRERKVAGVALVWKELTVSVRDKAPLLRPRRQEFQRLRAAGDAHRHHGTRALRQIHAAQSNRRLLLLANASHSSEIRDASVTNASHSLTHLGRLRGAERMYGEVFINGVKSRLPYGSYYGRCYTTRRSCSFLVSSLQRSP